MTEYVERNNTFFASFPEYLHEDLMESIAHHLETLDFKFNGGNSWDVEWFFPFSKGTSDFMGGLAIY